MYVQCICVVLYTIYDVCTMCIWYLKQRNLHTYGHKRLVYTVLAKLHVHPSYMCTQIANFALSLVIRRFEKLLFALLLVIRMSEKSPFALSLVIWRSGRSSVALSLVIWRSEKSSVALLLVIKRSEKSPFALLLVIKMSEKSPVALLLVIRRLLYFW